MTRLLPARSPLSPRTHWRNRRRVRRRASGRSFAYNLRLPGQIFDGQAGLHQNGLREYDPATARYAESDPIGLRGGTNTYVYVSGNPLSLTDASGLCPDEQKEKCEKLLADLLNLIDAVRFKASEFKGLAQRYNQLAQPYMTGENRRRHEDEFLARQRNLRKK